MLSLKDFKKYEVKEDGLMNINGGISCPEVATVMRILRESGSPQYAAVVNQLQNGGIQCTYNGQLYNIVIEQ